MNDLTIAAVFFVGTHIGLASTALRDQLVSSMGERLYRLVYSAIAALALGWMILAYRAAPFEPLWTTGPGLRHLALLVMPFAFLLVVSAILRPNPTALGQAPDADAPEPARGIIRVTRHPFLWGVALWALVHLLANGDRAALVFFGALGLLALVGTVLIDARRTRQNPPGWGIFVQRTSNLPMAAILQRRQRLVLSEIGLLPVAVALLLYVVLLVLHPWLFGAAVIG
jgi:uncharacterized membrane protein